MSASVSRPARVVDVGDAVGAADDLPLERLGDNGAGVAEDTHTHLIGEIQPGAAALKPVHHAQRLLVVVKGLAHDARERLLPGVAEGRVAQVVAVGGGLGQILVELQPAADRPGNARDLQRVGHARAVVVAFRSEKDLRLVHEPPEGFCVHDPVSIALIAGAHIAVLLGIEAALCLRGALGTRRKTRVLLLLDAFADCHSITPQYHTTTI